MDKDEFQSGLSKARTRLRAAIDGATSAFSALGDLPLEITHDVNTPLPDQADEDRVNRLAKKMAKATFCEKTGIPEADIPDILKRSHYDQEAKDQVNYLAKLLIGSRPMFRRMLLDRRETSDQKMADFNADLEKRQADHQQSQARKLQAAQARIDMLRRADALLESTSPDALQSRYEKSRKDDELDVLLFAEEVLTTASLENLAKIDEISAADREARDENRRLKKVDKRIAQWEADMLSKIGEADRRMAEIDKAKETAALNRFNPLVEMDKLLAPEPEKKSLEGFSKSVGELRF